MDVELVLIDDLTLDPKNARRHDDKNLAAIAESLRQFGQRKPIVVWGNTVVAGNGTLVAARSLGWKEIQVARVPDDWDEARVTAYALADNRSAELAVWDDQVLTEQLKELELADWDVEALGFEATVEPLQDIVEDEIPELYEAKAKLGQIWQLGRHRVMCGDSLNKNLVLNLVGQNSLDCIVTDPPYGIDLDTDYSKMGDKGQIHSKVLNDDKPFDFRIFDYLDCVEQFWFGANYYAKTLPDGGSWVVWDKYPTDNNDKRFGSLFELVWSKTKHKQIILRTPSLNVGHFKVEDIVHPTQKPSKLIIDILEKWAKPNANVLDVFGGSGSTLIACEQTDRTCFMMELDPKYVDVIIARWEKLTGEQAQLIEG